MKTLRTVQQVKEGMNFKKLSPIDGRFPVIVTIPVDSTKQELGVQFWTEEQISRGSAKNTDGSVSQFVEMYNLPTFEVGKTYSGAGAGAYGDVVGTVVKRTPKFITFKTSIPTPFRVKVRKDGNGEVIFPGAWCVRATSLKQ